MLHPSPYTHPDMIHYHFARRWKRSCHAWSPWCAGMVAVPKKDRTVRIYVDLKPLNTTVLGEAHPLPKVDDTLAQLSGAKVFSKLDANSGFWHIPIQDPGVSPSDGFHHPILFHQDALWYLQCLRTLPSTGWMRFLTTCLVFCAWWMTTSSMEKTSRNTSNDFNASRQPESPWTKRNVNLARSPSVSLVTSSAQTVYPQNPNKVKAITSMKTQTTTIKLQCFLGVVCQLGKFTPEIAELSKPVC